MCGTLKGWRICEGICHKQSEIKGRATCGSELLHLFFSFSFSFFASGFVANQLKLEEAEM